MKYLLIIDAELKQDMARLHAEWKRDSNSPAGREFQAAADALRALREGRESEYQGKQLGRGPSSYDLRDAAELKVPVFQRYNESGRPLGPSHRLIYREFEALPKVEDGRVVPDPTAQPYRQAVAFTYRGDDPAAVAGERLGRTRGMPQPELHGIDGGGRPSIGPDGREGIQTTPHRIPVPPDLIRQAAILRDSPPPTARPPEGTPKPSGSRPPNPGQSRERDR